MRAAERRYVKPAIDVSGAVITHIMRHDNCHGAAVEVDGRYFWMEGPIAGCECDPRWVPTRVSPHRFRFTNTSQPCSP